MRRVPSLLPIPSKDGVGEFPLRIFMPLGKCVLKIIDNDDSGGRNGPVEMYVCGVLIEIGV